MKRDERPEDRPPTHTKSVTALEDVNLLAGIRGAIGPPLGPEEQEEWDRRYDAGDYQAAAAKQKETETALVENSPSRPLLLAGSSTWVLSTRAEQSSTADRPSTRATLPYSSYEVWKRATDAGVRCEGKLPKPQFVTWLYRLAVEDGYLRPAPVDTAALPENCDAVTKSVWRGFVFLFACRWLHTPGEPAPFTREFAAPWCNVGEGQARTSIVALKRMEFMLPAGKHRRTTLWLPRGPK
jgi:hypothetical protein